MNSTHRSRNISNPTPATSAALNATFSAVAVAAAAAATGGPNMLLLSIGRSQPMSPSSDHHDTLKGFAAWRQSLPPAERLGIWQLLTACYGEGVQGLSYEAVRLYPKH